MEAAAERLGVTPRMVRRLVSERRIGFVRVGKHIRLRQQDLESYLDERFQPPLDGRSGR
jgi:excisionase family DNA binding protein